MRIEYPFQPKTIRSIKRGHFWSIPLKDGTFACGLAVEDPGARDPVTGSLQTRAVLSVLLAWHGKQAPILEDIEAIDKVITHGYMGSRSIAACDGFIQGQREMDAHPVVLPESVTHRGGGAVWVVRGSERVRLASKEEARDMQILGYMGNTLLSHVANRVWLGDGAKPKPTVKPESIERDVSQPGRPTARTDIEDFAVVDGRLTWSQDGAPRYQDVEPDRQALKTLMGTFWPRGQRLDPMPVAAVEHARDAGLMFAPHRLSHDEAVSWAVDMRSAISPLLVGAAFVDSLASRRLDLRSALGSYAASTHLRPHDHERWGPTCGLCGFVNQPVADLNVLNFERHKSGGVRHRSPLYVAFDLQQLTWWRTTEAPQGLDLFEQMLDRWSDLPAAARASDAARALQGLFPSNQNERRIVVEIAALAGILPTPLDGLVDRYVTYEERNDALPAGRSDWRYPAFAWRGSNGVNGEAMRALLSSP